MNTLPREAHIEVPTDSAASFAVELSAAGIDHERTGAARGMAEAVELCLRWTAAGMLEAETQFRRIAGYSDLAKLALAVERDLATRRPTIHTTTTEENALTTLTV